MNEHTTLAVATAGLVVGVYSAALPNLPETRARVDDGGHMTAGQQYAACVSGAMVLGVAAATRSATVAGIGLLSIVALSAAFRLACLHDPTA